jgi:hypothetical protein
MRYLIVESILLGAVLGVALQVTAMLLACWLICL